MFDWGDLKYFLMTARAGSTLRAAQKLGVSQTTVARRIDSLEKALALRLFDRNRDGYRLSEAGSTILALAEGVQDDAEKLEREAAAYSRQFAGVVRVASVVHIADEILTPLVAEFMERYPDIRIELIGKDYDLDLVRPEIAITVYSAGDVFEPQTILRKLAEGSWAAYCSRSYAEKHGKPAGADGLEGHFIVGAEWPLMRIAAVAWFAEAARPHAVRTTSSTLSNTVAAIRSGHGIGVLPLARAVRYPDLVPCFEIPDSSYGIYFLIRESVRDVPRVKAFTEFVLARAPEIKAILEKAPAEN